MYFDILQYLAYILAFFCILSDIYSGILSGLSGPVVSTAISARSGVAHCDPDVAGRGPAEHTAIGSWRLMSGGGGRRRKEEGRSNL